MPTLDLICAEGDIAVSGTSFDDLPNEITSKIIEKLSLEDRASLAATNERLNDLERKTGHRRFDRITFKPLRPQYFCDVENNRDLKIFPADLASIEDISSYLKHSMVKQLWIKGTIDHETEKSLSIAFKTVKFQELIVHVEDDYSGRIVSDLVKERKCIKKLNIGWWRPGKEEIVGAKKMLAGLPPIDTYNITSQKPIIDDGILLHLVRNSKCAYLYGETTVTTQGLARAFEMVCGSKKAKVVTVSVYTTAVNELIRSLDSEHFKVVCRREILSPREITHRKSGAKLESISDRISIIYSDVIIRSMNKVSYEGMFLY